MTVNAINARAAVLYQTLMPALSQNGPLTFEHLVKEAGKLNGNVSVYVTDTGGSPSPDATRTLMQTGGRGAQAGAEASGRKAAAGHARAAVESPWQASVGYSV